MKTSWRTFCLPLLLLALALAGVSAPPTVRTAAAMPASAAPAQTGCEPSGCFIFLPSVAVPAIVPILNAPADKEQVDSISPTLYWTPAITGTRFLIQVATSPLFSADTIVVTTTKSLKLTVRDPQFYVRSNNLKGSTIYYWRVGVVLPEGMIFTPVREFTTAVKDESRLPSYPQLLTPFDGERLTNLEPIFTWAAAPGADAYSVKILLADATTTFKTSPVIEMPRTDYSPTGFASKVVYYWQVRMHNSYGWGDYGPVPGWRFRTP